MIENTSINPASLSELASELGTMDYISDNRRSGRRKLEIAKIIPHENSIAQMIWIDQRVAPIGPIISNICSPKYNYKAEAKQFIAQEKWKDAVEIIRKWQSYQPFSKTHEMDGSYFDVDFLDDPRQAIQILDIGRVSNPHDPDITNNYIYSLIMNGDLEKASEQLRYQPVPSSLEADNLSLIATWGLWWYRKGCADIGKTFYELAIEQAHRLNQSDLEYRAMVYFAREEKRIGNDISHLRSILLNSKYREAYQSHLPLIKKFELLE